MSSTKNSPRRAKPDFKRERNLIKLGATNVVGIDEAGMGPWAGPVVAAAVLLDPRQLPSAIDDSKRLTAKRRAAAYDLLMTCAKVGIGIADVARIDRDNILRASQWAMRKALEDLGIVPDMALVDGRNVPDLGCRVEAIVDGDARIVSIAAASIVAKVTRDRIMIDLAKEHPDYGFDTHKGYGTAHHRAAIAKLGLTPAHRRSFQPIREAMAAAELSATGPPLTHAARKPE